MHMNIRSIQGTPLIQKNNYRNGRRASAVSARAVVSTHGGPRLASYTVAAISPTVPPVVLPGGSVRLRWYPVSMYASVVLVLSSFVLGVWFTWSTQSSQADTAQEEMGGYGRVAPGVIPIQSNGPLLAESDKVSEQNVLTMTMEQLENYLQVATTTPEKQAAETLRSRTSKLKTYLESKGSPLALFADTIAGLKHWRLVLAISNSESSLGRRCADNNCSGIGVMPGHPLWRTYATKAEWAKDLDKLIERRYKNWSLEKMNGVYNQPGSENWVFAARQILSDLQTIE